MRLLCVGRLSSSQLDVIVGNSGAPDELYRNNGFGNFTLVAGTSISQYNVDTTAIVVLDIDNDGDVRERPRALNQTRRQQHCHAISTAMPSALPCHRLCSREVSVRVIAARCHLGQL